MCVRVYIGAPSPIYHSSARLLRLLTVVAVADATNIIGGGWFPNAAHIILVFLAQCHRTNTLFGKSIHTLWGGSSLVCRGLREIEEYENVRDKN